MKVKYYSRKIKALGENYNLANFEYLHLDKKNRTGQIKNHFNNSISKVMQLGEYVDTLRFTKEEINNQFI